MSDPYKDVITVYSDNAARLADKYASYDRRIMFPFLYELLTPNVHRVLDVGSGSGIDARAFAEEGRIVTAVEPSGLMNEAQTRNNHANITWIRDQLPNLTSLNGQEGQFDLVFLNRVFMHIPSHDQVQALNRLFTFLSPQGWLYMITRHGPSLDGRLMFETDLDVVRKTAEQAELVYTLRAMNADWDGRPEITWSTITISRV